LPSLFAVGAIARFGLSHWNPSESASFFAVRVSPERYSVRWGFEKDLTYDYRCE
jgi:hypothetical protein